MNYANAVDFIYDAHVGGSRRAVILYGPPGIGKTSVARTVLNRLRADEPDEEWVEVFLDSSTKVREDIAGLPVRNPDTGTVEFVLIGDLARAFEGKKVMVLLDDIAHGPPSVQAGFRQLVLERRIGDAVMHPDSIVIATANRPQDGAGARALPSHFSNSTVALNVAPTVEDWQSWAMGAGVDSSIIGFLMAKREMFWAKPDTATAEDLGAFPTPRSWHMLSDVIKATQRRSARTAAVGCVGGAAAAEYAAYLSCYGELPDIAALLDDPHATMPEPEVFYDGRPDWLIATVMSLCDLALNEDRGRNTHKDHIKFWRALGHLINVEGFKEFVFMGFQVFSARADSTITNKVTRSLRKLAQSDPDIKAMVDFVKLTLYSANDDD